MEPTKIKQQYAKHYEGVLTSSYEFPEGGMWEEAGWDIVVNEECSENGGGEPCRHCHSAKTLEHVRSDGSKYYEKVWLCPHVVTASNEGGFNSTGVCLDCILEASDWLKK